MVALDIVLLQGPRRGLFLTSEVPLQPGSKKDPATYKRACSSGDIILPGDIIPYPYSHTG